VLHQGYQPFDDWQQGYQWLWAPYGDDGAILALAQVNLAQLEHDALIDQRLAPWLAGRDAIIDIGDAEGIHSQPDRPDLDEIAAYDEADAASFQTEVVDGLSALADGSDAILDTLAGVQRDDRWTREVYDGVAITALRARFAAQITAGALDVGAGGDAADQIDAAQALLDEAGTVVARRDADLHDPRSSRLLEEADNPTLYDYGYLLHADQLCYWQRELGQLQELAGGSATVPGCAL